MLEVKVFASFYLLDIQQDFDSVLSMGPFMEARDVIALMSSRPWPHYPTPGILVNHCLIVSPYIQYDCCLSEYLSGSRYRISVEILTRSMY